MGSFSGYSSTVLIIKNFPLLFNDHDREEFLEHFGAVRVRCLPRFKNTSNLIIADFGSNTQASQALLRLHQLEILARRLVVEYSPLDLAYFAFSTSLYDDKKDAILNGISPGINEIHYSLPSEKLSYLYPPIDETILTNIDNALLSVPAFYTQVLHLMNKMSLPCPMIADSTTMPRTLSTSNIPGESSEVVKMDTDESESEIDDGEEEERVKRHRRAVLQTTVSQGTASTMQIGNTSVDIEKKKKPTIELKLPPTLDRSQIKVSQLIPVDIALRGFGRMEPTKSIISTSEISSKEKQQQLPPLPLIPLEELAQHRLSEDQLRLIDHGRLYRNYERGQPSQRLYIKNIDTKYVDERLLHSLYDRYTENSFPIDIRLMCEGKMKGQAFVTFPNENMALKALNDTNGYILHEKPLIVQFARSAKPKDTV